MGADSAARIERVDIFGYDLTYRHGDHVGRVPDGPGLGIEVDASALGEPIWSTAA